MITAQQEIVSIFFLKKFFQTIVTINSIIITISFLVVKPRCNCKIKTSSLPPWTQFQRVLVAAGGKFSKFDVTIRATRAPSHKTREREKGRPRMETGFSTKNRKISNFLSLGRKSGFPTFYALLPLFLFLFSFLSSFFFFFFILFLPQMKAKKLQVNDARRILSTQIFPYFPTRKKIRIFPSLDWQGYFFKLFANTMISISINILYT